MTQDDIGWKVHHLIVSLDDLSKGLQDPSTRQLIERERDDLQLANAQLTRLLRRMDEPVEPVNQVTLIAAE